MRDDTRHVLWWGRSDLGYSRNRVILQALDRLGYTVDAFSPKFSRFGDLEYQILNKNRGRRYALVWIPCFRQRDAGAGVRVAKSLGIPCVFDPLISAYDKQVFERKKIGEHTRKAENLLSWESRLFNSVDYVIGDTCSHVDYFVDTFGISKSKCGVIPVGAEERLFEPSIKSCDRSGKRVEVLFYGSFVPLQGVDVIIEAARLYDGCDWVLLGDGKGKTEALNRAVGINNLKFEDWIDYKDLAFRIQKSDILLGIFGSTQKAKRVIPNKVYQALACGRPVVTAFSDCYDQSNLKFYKNGINFCDANPLALAECVKRLVDVSLNPKVYVDMCHGARAYFEHYFSFDSICDSTEKALLNIDIK